MKKLKQYYHYGSAMYLIHTFTKDGVKYAVCEDGDGYLETFRFNELKIWEETYNYQEQQKIKQETAKLEAQRADMVKQIKDEVLSSMILRIKLNSIFSKDDKLTPVGLELANQIEQALSEKKIESL